MERSRKIYSSKLMKDGYVVNQRSDQPREIYHKRIASKIGKTTYLLVHTWLNVTTDRYVY